MGLNVAAWILAAACQFADIHTTNRAFNMGFAEGNPILGEGKGKVFSVKLSLDAGIFLAWYKTRDKKASIVFPVALAGAGCTGAAFNAQAIRRSK